jgi:hypothetical protein
MSALMDTAKSARSDAGEIFVEITRGEIIRHLPSTIFDLPSLP